MLDPLPILTENAPGSGNAAVPFAYSDTDGFSLYAAILQAKLNAGGSGFPGLVSWPWNPAIPDLANVHNMTNQRLMLVGQLVKGGVQIDGVGWVQVTAGAYTAAPGNQIGAYTYDGTTWTRVAQCASINALWAPATGFANQAFTTPYIPPNDMILWAAGLWNQTAVVTNPVILSTQAQNGDANNLGLNTALGGAWSAWGSITNAGVLPATIPAGSVGHTTNLNYWLAFYHQY